jgi:hypothetical protein
MRDQTNIAAVTTNEELTELYCIECANRLFQGLPNVEIQQRYSWENNEADSPSHCPECGVLLEETMTEQGLEYVRAEIVEALSDGKSIALDEESAAYAWHQRYGQQVAEELETCSSQAARLEEILDYETVLHHYLTAQLWTGSIDFMTATEEHGGEPLISDNILDSVASVADLPEEIRSQAVTDVDSFIDQVSEYLKYWELPENLTAEQLGHDFSLTRNHHGAGFWDRGWQDLGDWLTRVSQSFGSCSLYGAVILKDISLPDPDLLATENLDLSTLTIWSD